MLANLGYQRDTPGKRELELKDRLHQIGLCACLSGHFLDWQLIQEGPTYMNSAIHEWTGLGYTRKVVECETQASQ